MMENHVLKSHVEYFVNMQTEKNELSQEFQDLKLAETQLLERAKHIQGENELLENKTKHLERNATTIHPEKQKELNEKLDGFNSVLKSKDDMIEQLLREISTAKNLKDYIQKEVLFKRQKIDNMNMEFNSKEMEYQRIWEECQEFKAEIRGETTDCHSVKSENDMLQRELQQIQEELIRSSTSYDR